MEYVGLQTQINRNNTKSIILLVMFPLLLIGLTAAFFYLLNLFLEEPASPEEVLDQVTLGVPAVLIAVSIWFAIAWFSHSKMIQRATGSRPLERQVNKRVYNLLENLCISRGLDVPKLFIIDDSSLNAFASGLSKKTYAISLSRGIIDKLNDDELEGVIAHELSHIRNRDVRLLIVSIVFVGIFAFLTEFALRSMRFSNRGKKDKGSAAILIILLLAAVGWLLSAVFRFAISRKREYLADAGAVELTKKPLALASALEKVSSDPAIEAVERDDVAQLFFEHPQVREQRSFLTSVFATHPPIQERIKVLRQF